MFLISSEISMISLKLNICYIQIYFSNSFNRISALPRGFGAFPLLEVLDLTYNNLSEKSLPNNFFELSNLFEI